MQIWTLDYLSNRPQHAKTKLETSAQIALYTGAPQGCVLSPVLFILYTNDLQWHSDNAMICKYADDTVITGFIKNEYLDCTHFVNEWCKHNFLDVNLSKK